MDLSKILFYQIAFDDSITQTQSSPASSSLNTDENLLPLKMAINEKNVGFSQKIAKKKLTYESSESSNDTKVKFMFTQYLPIKSCGLFIQTENMVSTPPSLPKIRDIEHLGLVKFTRSNTGRKISKDGGKIIPRKKFNIVTVREQVKCK